MNTLRALKANRKTYRMVQGMRPSTIKAACRYIDGLLEIDVKITQREISDIHNVTETAIVYAWRKIAKLLNLYFFLTYIEPLTVSWR